MMEVTRNLYRRELLKGSTETLLLSLLVRESMYGYQLVKEMDRRSSGYFRFKEGTLYPALHRLERDEWIVGTWGTSPNGQKRRYYNITAKGLSRLESMLEEWNKFTEAVHSPNANIRASSTCGKTASAVWYQDPLEWTS